MCQAISHQCAKQNALGENVLIPHYFNFSLSLTHHIQIQAVFVGTCSGLVRNISEHST